MNAATRAWQANAIRAFHNMRQFNPGIRILARSDGSVVITIEPPEHMRRGGE